MVLVLALDTSTPAVSVALVELTGSGTWGRQADFAVVDGQRHGELLATGVAAVLAELGAVPGDVSAVAVGLGPGPFTGLRVGVVTAAATADALGVPAYGVCSLDAVGAWDDDAGPRLVVTDARRREVYWAEYDEAGRRVHGPVVEAPAALAGRLRDAGWDGRVLGAGALAHPELFPTATGPAHPAADALVLLAASRVLTGAPSEDLVPLYLRRPDAALPGPVKTVTA